MSFAFDTATPDDVARWFAEEYAPRMGTRGRTFAEALIRLRRIKGRLIVETGCVREPGNWGGDGQSTLVFAEYGRKFGAAVVSIDSSWDACKVAQAALRAVHGKANHCSVWNYDGAVGLSNIQQPIDLLYLDSMDYRPGREAESQAQALSEFKAAEPWLHKGSVVLIDDCDRDGGGKGGRVVPHAEGRGWTAAMREYQTLLVKEP